MDEDTKGKIASGLCCAIPIILILTYFAYDISNARSANEKINSLETNKDMAALISIIEDPKSDDDAIKSANEAIANLYALNDTQMNKLVDDAIANKYKLIDSKETAEKWVNYGNYLESKAARQWAKDNGYDIHTEAKTPFN